MVVEVEQRGGTIRRGSPTTGALGGSASDAPILSMSVEGGTAALCLLVAVGEGLCHGWLLMLEALRCPYRKGTCNSYSEAGRSMKEEASGCPSKMFSPWSLV